MRPMKTFLSSPNQLNQGTLCELIRQLKSYSFYMGPAKTQIKLGIRSVGFWLLLGANIFCIFCHASAHFSFIRINGVFEMDEYEV